MSDYLYRLAHMAFRRKRLVLAIWLAAAIVATAIVMASGGKTTTVRREGRQPQCRPRGDESGACRWQAGWVQRSAYPDLRQTASDPAELIV
jgi:hypothetical protein